MICVIIKYKSETSSVWVSVLYAHPFRCTYPHLLTFIWKWDRKLHPASMQNLQQAGPAACPAILPCSSLWCGMEAPASISSNNRCTLLGVAQTWRYSKVLIATDRQTSALLWAAGPAQLTAVQFQPSHLKKNHCCMVSVPLWCGPPLHPVHINPKPSTHFWDSTPGFWELPAAVLQQNYTKLG